MKSVTSNDIVSYLKDMKAILSTPDALVIKETEKNFKFKYLYKLDRDRIVEILDSLQVDEFDKKIESTNKEHLGEVLYVWNPIRSFIDASGKSRDIQLYIKTQLIKNKRLVVISFHEYRDYGEN